MYIHNVLFKVKEGTTPSQLEELCRNVTMLNGIPGVVLAFVSKNLSPEKSRGRFTHGILVVLEDSKYLKPYLENPSHTEFANRFVHPIREGEGSVFDYEF